jgi:flagellar protein FlbD
MILGPIDENRIKEIREVLEKEFSAPIPDEEIRKWMPGIPIRRSAMIEVTKLNDKKFMLNSELIETFESTPDTVISLVTGRKYIVKESVEEVRNKCIAFKQKIFQNTP